MKKLILVLIALVSLTGCPSANGPGQAPSVTSTGSLPMSPDTPAAGGGNNVVNINPLVQQDTPTPTPTQTPVATCTPAPTPTPIDTNTPYQYAQGSGTSDSPYQVASADDFKHMADYPSASFKVMNNIDLYGVMDLKPIGTNNRPFSGTFDGNGKIIMNLAITYSNSDLTEPTAIFSVVTQSAVIEDVAFSNARIVNDTGAAAGVVGMLQGTNASHPLVINTIFYGTVASGKNPYYGVAPSVANGNDTTQPYLPAGLFSMTNISVNTTSTIAAAMNSQNQQAGSVNGHCYWGTAYNGGTFLSSSSAFPMVLPCSGMN